MERRARPLPSRTSQINLADYHLRPANNQSSPHVDQNRNKVVERRAHKLPLPPIQISVADHSMEAANDRRSSYSDRTRNEFMERRAQPLPLPPTQISVFDHPLGPATDHCLGKPLPQQPQLAKQAPPRARSSIFSSAYRFFAGIFRCSCRPRRTQARMQSNHPQTEVTPSTNCSTRVQGERLGSNVMLRKVSEESINSPVTLDCRGNQVVNSYRGFQGSSKDAPNILRRECKGQGLDDSVLKLANKRHVDGGRANNMGRTRKHQTQLIDHYETLKKIQRDLEHKVRENNRGKQIMQESMDMGYHYDGAKERDEANALHLRSAIHGQESSHASNTNILHELNSNEQSHEISDVLDSLKQAKISLQQEINSGISIQTSSLVSSSEGSGMPVGSSYLFRLPTDFSDVATSRYNICDSNLQFGLNVYPGRDTSRNFYGNLGTNPYPGTVLTSTDDQSLANRYMGTGSTFDTTTIPPHPEEEYTTFSSMDSTPVGSPNSSPGEYNSTNSYLRYIQPRSTFDPATHPPNFCEKVYARFDGVDSTLESSPNNSPGRHISGSSGGQCSTIPSDNRSLSTKETCSRPDTEGSHVVPSHLSSGRNMDPSPFPISPAYENATHTLPMVW